MGLFSEQISKHRNVILAHGPTSAAVVPPHRSSDDEFNGSFHFFTVNQKSVDKELCGEAFANFPAGYHSMLQEFRRFKDLKPKEIPAPETLLEKRPSALDAWNKISAQFPLHFPIVAYIYSIPVSSANVERLFSITRFLNHYSQLSSSANTLEIKSFLHYNYDAIEDVLLRYINEGSHKISELLPGMQGTK